MEVRTETRTVEAPEVEVESERTALYSIRWSAIFAGLAVGVGVHLLLMLIGVAAGFAVFGAGERPQGETLSIGAAIWNLVSMVIAALIGGYVASRSSGLRRTSDGMLHGAVAWGATVLAFALVTGTVAGNTLGSLFGVATTTAASQAAARGGPDLGISELFASIQRGDRAATVQMLQERFGMTPEQANRAADQAATMIGQGRPATPGTESPEVTDAARAATAASVWLAAAILLSLLAAAGGGLMGAHGAQRRSVPHVHRRHHVDTRVTRRQVTTAG